MAAVLGHAPPKRLGVAVSGGGDSVALLSVLVAYARDHDIELHVITIDHGVRPEAAREIAFVRDLCAKWNLSHDVAHWTEWDEQGNFQAAARAARYALMADWARDRKIAHIALGHTADDQAETFLMRLARSAGVDGLSAMAPRRISHAVTWIRPFLQTDRATLRAHLKASQLQWCEDPSNENRDYQRIKARDALKVLNTLGISVESLGQVTQNMARARDALMWQTFIATRDMVKIRHGVIAIDIRGFLAQPEEIGRRLLTHSVQWVSGSVYGPRGPAIARALASVRAGATTTLDRCQVMTKNGVVWVFREYNAVRDTVCAITQNWDDRWRVTGPQEGRALEVRALGFEALNRFEDWRGIGLPRAALASSPSVWYKEELIAAPIVMPDAEWKAELEYGVDTYFAALLSH
ncbi:tRNA lysidine(34) synthetase TilS [Tateyamaria pelophila]|uniref:tRNA lysidine(34) synthetase TilS n=1 Tax=Tateyamaria pelophila TaxID=328415 RepID=UPI001CBFD994|nr:tRNA lysidine(34) synthetase TilS [Tateyamaria pelophila]